MTTPTTPARIRWTKQPSLDAIESLGYVGMLQWRSFIIYRPGYDGGQYRLLGLIGNRNGESLYADDPDELKAEAEHWLSEFASSLGAIFPDVLRGQIERERAFHNKRAADLEGAGKRGAAAEASGRVDGYDEVLATMDRMTARESAVMAAREEDR